MYNPVAEHQQRQAAGEWIMMQRWFKKFWNISISFPCCKTCHYLNTLLLTVQIISFSFFFFQKHQRETIKYFLPCPAGTVKIKSTHAITIPYCNYSDIPVIIDGKTTAAEQIQTWRRFPVNIWKKTNKKKRYQTVEGEKYNSDRLNSEQRYCIQMSAWAPLQLTSPTLSAMSNMLHTPWFIKRLIDCSSNTKCHFANLIMGVKSHSQSQVSL